MAPVPFHISLLYVVGAAAVEAYFLRRLFPAYALDESIAKSTEYLVGPNFLVYVLYRWYVAPLLFSPYKNLPGPKVSVLFH
jgi:hypothetical protein